MLTVSLQRHCLSRSSSHLRHRILESSCHGIVNGAMESFQLFHSTAIRPIRRKDSKPTVDLDFYSNKLNEVTSKVPRRRQRKTESTTVPRDNMKGKLPQFVRSKVTNSEERVEVDSNLPGKAHQQNQRRQSTSKYHQAKVVRNTQAEYSEKDTSFPKRNSSPRRGHSPNGIRRESNYSSQRHQPMKQTQQNGLKKGNVGTKSFRSPSLKDNTAVSRPKQGMKVTTGFSRPEKGQHTLNAENSPYALKIGSGKFNKPIRLTASEKSELTGASWEKVGNDVKVAKKPKQKVASSDLATNSKDTARKQRRKTALDKALNEIVFNDSKMSSTHTAGKQRRKAALDKKRNETVSSNNSKMSSTGTASRVNSPNQVQVDSKATFALDVERLELFVSCLPGFEPILSAELMALDMDHLVLPGGATLVSPSVSDLLDCHLFLGTASHVLLRCGQPFSAHGLAELRRKVSKTEWGSVFAKDVKLDIRVTSYKSDLYHTGAVAERVKLGIFESLGIEQPDDSDPSSSGEGVTSSGRSDESSHGKIADSVVPLTVRINRDMVSISIDTSSSPIHQRAYRLQTAKAPLREDLAYAMLYSAGWQPTHSRLRYKDENTGRQYSALLDPLCGSGTIAVEAAVMASGFPPGRLRPAPLIGTTLYDPVAWHSLVKSAVSDRGDSKEFYISASDREIGAIQAAIGNAKRAGVSDCIEFSQRPLSSCDWFVNPAAAPKSILVATNPPFGKRISPIGLMKRGDNHPLLPLYQKIGHQIKQLKKSKGSVGAVILAQDLRLARRTALEDFDVAFTSHHGGMPVSALVMGHSATAAVNSEESADESHHSAKRAKDNSCV